MHHIEAVEPRRSAVVERDWIRDEYVVTWALSHPDGRVIWSTQSRLSADEWEPGEVEAMVSRLIAAQGHM